MQNNSGQSEPRNGGNDLLWQDAETLMEIAQRRPRNIKRFLDDTKSIIQSDPAIARSCEYVIPRAGGEIRGPSAFFAKLLIANWPHIFHATKPIRIEEKHVIVAAIVRDLQLNNTAYVECRRKIVDRNGRRFSDDMIQVTEQAAQSIALRNAVFRVIPPAVWKPLYDEAMRIAREAERGADPKTSARRAVQWFARHGIDAQSLCRYLGTPSPEAFGREDIARLRGLATAIEDGEITIDEVLTGGTAGETAAISTVSKCRRENDITDEVGRVFSQKVETPKAKNRKTGKSETRKWHTLKTAPKDALMEMDVPDAHSEDLPGLRNAPSQPDAMADSSNDEDDGGGGESNAEMSDVAVARKVFSTLMVQAAMAGIEVPKDFDADSATAGELKERIDELSRQLENASN